MSNNLSCKNTLPNQKLFLYYKKHQIYSFPRFCSFKRYLLYRQAVRAISAQEVNTKVQKKNETFESLEFVASASMQRRSFDHFASISGTPIWNLQEISFPISGTNLKCTVQTWEIFSCKEIIFRVRNKVFHSNLKDNHSSLSKSLIKSMPVRMSAKVKDQGHQNKYLCNNIQLDMRF